MSSKDASERTSCHDGGYLVDSEYSMLGPGDPPLSEAEVRDGRIKGCDHIRCQSCGQTVMQIPNAIWKRPWPVATTLREARARGTLADLVELRPELPHRIYACECKYETALGARSFDALWDDYCHPWSCAGHEQE